MAAITEGAELTGESGKTYLAVGPLGQANVWTAVDKDDPSNIVVLKAPSPDDASTGWPLFQHEMIMHELLKDCTAIRKQVDRIPPVRGSNSPPILVLEIFETTLWEARTKRPFSKNEIESVARSILRGLQEVHDQGLVYIDLKMQNVMLNGFDNAESGDGGQLITKLGDLGIVMKPAIGKAQPVAYRAPEVYFKGELTQAADIWAFGLIYCHLLEAQSRFSKTGLYDDLDTGGGTMPEREQAMRYAIANDYDIENMEYYKDCPTPYRNPSHETGNQWEELRHRGLDEREIDFLQSVLTSDPRKRPTAQAILDTHFLDKSRNGTQAPAISTEEAATLAGAQTDNSTPNGEDGLAQDSTSHSAGRAAPPTSISMPPRQSNPLKRLASSDVFTPTGSGAFESMLHKRTENGSPIKEHPLVMQAISQSEEKEDDVVGEENAPNEAAAATQNPAPWRSEPQSGVSGSSDNTAPVTADAAASQRPEYIGRNSSTGGTYLSYR